MVADGMPKTIMAALIILWLQVVVSVGVMAAAIVSIYFKATTGFWRGFQTGLTFHSGATSLAAYGPYHAGVICGSISFLLLLVGGNIWAIKTRRFSPAMIFSVLLILLGLKNCAGALLPIAVLILTCITPSRRWFARPPPLPH